MAITVEWLLSDCKEILNDKRITKTIENSNESKNKESQ